MLCIFCGTISSVAEDQPVLYSFKNVPATSQVMKRQLLLHLSPVFLRFTIVHTGRVSDYKHDLSVLPFQRKLVPGVPEPQE